MNVRIIPLAGPDLTDAVAGYLLEQQAAALPDLSALTVLVANQRAGHDLGRALARHCGLPSLIPPQITPLAVWAARVAGAAPEPQRHRLARLHGVLRGQAWLGPVDRWALAQELLALADALSAARLGDEIASRLRALRPDLLDQETRLIEAVWQSLNRDGTDPQAVYARQLDTLACQAAAPLYGYALGPLSALEKRFLARYGERAPVHLFSLATTPDQPLAYTLHQAWQFDGPPLRTRAAHLAEHFPHPVTQALTVYAAPHLEGEARAVATWVADQLRAGRRSIALIALDREAARRSRALLERLNVYLADETGWTLSTTMAAAVIVRWLDCVQRDFPHSELLDLLKSPFVLGDVAVRQDAVLAFELAMRRSGVAAGAAPLCHMAQTAAPEALPWLKRFADAARNFSQTRAPLGVWLTRLQASLDALGATPLLAQDAAGAHLLATFGQALGELADDAEKYSFAEWRRWLDLTLENESFVDSDVDSPIVLTSLPAARGRRFEAVAVIGADARHLPAPVAAGLFNQATRAQLGLPTCAEQTAQTIDDLLHLLPQGPCLLSWQAWRDDEPCAASPLVIRLQTLHEASWQCALASQRIDEPATQASVLPVPTRRPAPVIAPERLPRRYSPTAYQTLIDCPYRFFARNVLGLTALDEADEMLDKSDYGNALHRILKRFHDADPPLEQTAAQDLLQRVSEAEFARFPAYTALNWRTQWARFQPAYIENWLASCAAGWRYASGESVRELSLDLPTLGAISLQGRIDRIDQKDGALQVLDYKTSATPVLKKKRDAPEENIQLPFYAYLCDAAAAYLPLNDDRLAPIALGDDTAVEAIVLRLPRLLESLARGASLPAHGVETVCRHCEAQGLCRKGMWSE